MNTGAETERRKVNLMDALLVIALTGFGTMIFSMRDTLIGLKAEQKSMTREFVALQAQYNDVPRRVTVLETRQAVNIEAIKDIRIKLERHH